MVKLLENTFRMIIIGLARDRDVCGRMGIMFGKSSRRLPSLRLHGILSGVSWRACIDRSVYLSWKSKQAGIEARFISWPVISTGNAAICRDKVQNAGPIRASPSKARIFTFWAWPTSKTSTICANRGARHYPASGGRGYQVQRRTSRMHVWFDGLDMLRRGGQRPSRLRGDRDRPFRFRLQGAGATVPLIVDTRNASRA